jgi:hypothetical protein
LIVSRYPWPSHYYLLNCLTEASGPKATPIIRLH